MLYTNCQLEEEINTLHVPSLDTLYRVYQEESAILRLNYIDYPGILIATFEWLRRG